jgi:hypothetical protein
MNQDQKDSLGKVAEEGNNKCALAQKYMAEKCFRADPEDIENFTACFTPVNKVCDKMESVIYTKLRFVQFRLDQCFEKTPENKPHCIATMFGSVEKIFTSSLEDVYNA